MGIRAAYGLHEGHGPGGFSPTCRRCVEREERLRQQVRAEQARRGAYRQPSTAAPRPATPPTRAPAERPAPRPLYQPLGPEPGPPDPELGLEVLTSPPHARARSARRPLTGRAVVFMIVVTGLLIVTTAVTVGQELVPRYSDEPPDVGVALSQLLIALLLTAGVGLAPLWLRMLSPVTVPGVLDYLPLELLRAREHGTPGETLSLGRFGEAARTGRLGEDRTARIVRERLIPAFPALRVIHGVQWPGTDHADLDHVLVAGRLVVIVDSKLWSAEHAWWDGKKFGWTARRGRSASSQPPRPSPPSCRARPWRGS